MVASITGVALSGLRANETRIQVAADNIANVSTPNYKTAFVNQSTDQDGSVRTSVSRTDAPNNLDEQLVNVNVAADNFKANLKVIQAQHNLDKHLFDIQA